MLGATQFKERTEADDATSLELVIEPWLETIGSLLANQLQIVSQISEAERQKLFKVEANALLTFNKENQCIPST